jgi:hypothetical protein
LDPTHILKAIAFAADKHRRQRRKDAEASPYINHPIAVATVLASEGDVSDEPTLLAALPGAQTKEVTRVAHLWCGLAVVRGFACGDPVVVEVWTWRFEMIVSAPGT